MLKIDIVDGLDSVSRHYAVAGSVQKIAMDASAEITSLRTLLKEVTKVIKPFAEDAPLSKRGNRENTYIYGYITENDLFAARKWMEKANLA